MNPEANVSGFFILKKIIPLKYNCLNLRRIN